MKFCFILTQDLESPSGLGRYYPWANELNKLGHRVDIIALHGNYKDLLEKKLYLKNNFSVHYVAQMHVLKKGNIKEYFHSIKLIWIVFVATIRLFYFSQKTKADIFIVGKPHPMNGIAGIVCKIISRKKIIVDCDDDEANSGNFKGKWQQKIIRFFEVNIPRFADLVTTNTNYSKERLKASGISEDGIYFLSNGVDPERFNNIDERKLKKLHNDLGLSNKKVIAYIGSLSLSNHAVDILIDAFELVIKEKKNYRLLLVGGGEDFEKLLNYVRNKRLIPYTIFTGRVTPNDVKYYYKLADITIDPVKNDIAAKARSPLKIFESWECGVPVLTGKVGDRIDLFRDNSSCLLVTENETPMDIKISILNFFKRSPFENHHCSNLSKKYYWGKLVESLVDNNEKLFGKCI